jgi:hypothetical protein
MNLVASEYVACQEALLSEFTGAAAFMKHGGLLFNPLMHMVSRMHFTMLLQHFHSAKFTFPLSSHVESPCQKSIEYNSISYLFLQIHQIPQECFGPFRTEENSP